MRAYRRPFAAIATPSLIPKTIVDLASGKTAKQVYN